MKTFYDVLQLLKQFGTYIYVGSRIGDLAMAALELDRMYQAGVIEQKTYLAAKLVIAREHRLEEKRLELKQQKNSQQ